MISVLEPVSRACDLTVPPAHRRGIGVVGAGVIVDVAHLPAYRQSGLHVVGVLDRDPGRADEVARRHGTVAVKDLDEMLQDPRVEVIDIAVPPDHQPEIARAAFAAGKHVLCQKPLALDLAVARALVDEAQAAGVSLVVNQQLRYDEGIMAARAMVDLGWIGAASTLSIDVDILSDWSAWPWLVESPRLDLLYHSIHYLDAIRGFFGDPTTVFCVTGRREGQLPVGETRTISSLRFDGDRNAVVHVNHENLAGDRRASFRIDGSSGSIRGTIGLLYDYPQGRVDTLEVWSESLPTDGWLPYPVTRRWIPDAFQGPMASLLAEVAEGKRAPTSGADNVRTLQLLEALYRSAAEERSVSIDVREEGG